MAGFKGLIIGSILILLFTFSLITFYASWNLANNPNGNMNNNTYLTKSLSGINSTLADTQKIAASALNVTSSDTPSLTFIFLMFESFWKAPKIMLSIATSSFNIMIGMILVNLFGTDSSSAALVFVLDIFGAIFILVLILSFIKFVRTGNDET